MKRLYLVRHAKSDWGTYGLADFELTIGRMLCLAIWCFLRCPSQFDAIDTGLKPQPRCSFAFIPAYTTQGHARGCFHSVSIPIISNCPRANWVTEDALYSAMIF